MKKFSKKLSSLVLSFIGLVLICGGIFAGTTLVINSGQGIKIGSGSAEFLACDNDVDITTLTYNDGNRVYLQGFQYDNVDKLACVNFDFDTRFVSNSGELLNLFTTTSLASESNLIRVFATSSSSSWQLGLGARPSAEVTVTQLSASSFRVIFTNPIALANDVGKIVMAIQEHLPTGGFNIGYSEVGTVTGVWYGSCLVANDSKFYALENSQGLYQSSTIPKFPGAVSGLTISKVTSSAIPTSGVTWYALGCSRDGKYIAIGGTSNQLSYSSDYGNTWESRTASTFLQANAGTPGTNTQISISDDGAIVALGTSGGGSVTSGYFNFWVNKNFWTSPNTNADAITVVTAGASAVKVCGQGDIIYGGGNSGSQGLFRWNSSQFRSGGLKETITAVTNSSFGTAIRSIGCSLDGNRAVLASPFSSTVDSRVVVTSNKFISGNYYPANFSSNNLTQSDAQRPWSVHMSADGKFVTVGTGSFLGRNNGTTQVSSDYGVSLTNTSFINRYMQTITISDSGSRIITGGGVGSTKVVILSSS